MAQIHKGSGPGTDEVKRLLACTFRARRWIRGRTGFDGAYDNEWASQVRYDLNCPQLV